MAKKLVCGKGYNDVEGPFVWWEDGKRVTCPYYRKWASMLNRCYSPKFLERMPSYIGSYVCEDWLTFSNFKNWMLDKDWMGKHLDKDILVPNNKVYSPETCAFVTPLLNTFLGDKSSARGRYILGVYKSTSGDFAATCGQLNGKLKHLGTFKTQEEAHNAWLSEKIRLAEILASEQTDERVGKALVDRYKNYFTVEGKIELQNKARLGFAINDIQSAVDVLKIIPEMIDISRKLEETINLINLRA